MASAEALRDYARIFAKRRRYKPGGVMHDPGEISLAASECCRMVADAIDRADTYLPPEWRKHGNQTSRPE